MSAPLEGRVALVTGASRGIGEAIALALGSAGAELVVTSRREDGCRALVDALERVGRRAVALRYDAERSEEAGRLVEGALSAFGRVDVLINNAATVHRAPLARMTDEDFTRVLTTNLAAPFQLTRRLVPAMVERRWGRVVNVSSISATLGTPSLTAYCASKWGLDGLTRALAAELKGTGVMALAVLPGSVDTEMLAGSGFEPEIAPEEIARVVRFLCAEAPLSMNGSLVEVFG